MTTNELEEEFQWLNEVIGLATSLHVKNLSHHSPYFHEKAFPPAPPKLSDDGFYGRMVKQWGLSVDERLCLILALAPYFRPQILDILMAKNPNFDAVCTEFGGVVEYPHRGVIPTIETFLFILAGRDLQKRSHLMRVFNPKQVLIKQNILEVQQKDKQPLTSSKIVPDSETIDIMLYGEAQLPTMGPTWPAQQISTRMDWRDLILPEITISQIKEIENWLGHHDTLMQDEVLSKRIKPGFRGLFYGPPGTGKTLAATLLGKYTKLPVFRIDLSQIVSKYIGETEKNLSRVFDKAANKNWILFFDEADALFGKRSKTESSNDRYANQEVSYLLQRVESHPGLVVLATNFKGNIDQAFLRRFQTIIHFPFPEFAQRLELWKSCLPTQFKLDNDIDLRHLAGRYEFTGSHIVNVMQTCCLKALSAKSNVISKDILNGAMRKEMAKEEKIFEEIV
jgi:hypothetical protein